MKRPKKHKNVKNSIFRALTFFLLVPLLLNLIGNFAGISGQYTYYHYGYNTVAIASRFIENTIFNIGWRVFLLGLTTLIGSGFMYFLYHYAKKGRFTPLILGFLIYFADYVFLFSPHYYETKAGYMIANFMHLTFLAFFGVGLLLYFLINPVRRGFYDYA